MSSEAARAAPRDRLLCELLLDAGLLGVADLERGLALQQKIGGRLGSVLMRIGAVSEDNLLQVLSAQLGLPLLGQDVALPDVALVRATAALAPAGIDWSLDQQVLLWTDEGGALWCASRDPIQPALADALRDPLRQQGGCPLRELTRELSGLRELAR